AASAAGSGAGAACERPGSVDDAAALKPRVRIAGIRLEPGARAAEPEAVAPRVHVLHEARAAPPREFTPPEYLQVAHRRLLVVVAARIAVQLRAALRGHADEVACLVQHRVHRRVGARVDLIALQSGLALPPVGAGDEFAGRGQLQLHAIAGQE